MDTELADVALQVDAVDEGVRTAVKRIDEDLEALDQRVNHHRQECERTSAELEAANGKIAILDTGGKGTWKQVRTCQEH